MYTVLTPDTNSAMDTHCMSYYSTQGVTQPSTATRWNTSTPITKRLWFLNASAVGMLQKLVALNLQGVLNHQNSCKFSRHCDFTSHCTVAATSILMVEWKCG
jgi:hypothetical protein